MVGTRVFLPENLDEAAKEKKRGRGTGRRGGERKLTRKTSSSEKIRKLPNGKFTNRNFFLAAGLTRALVPPFEDSILFWKLMNWSIFSSLIDWGGYKKNQTIRSYLEYFPRKLTFAWWMKKGFEYELVFRNKNGHKTPLFLWTWFVLGAPRTWLRFLEIVCEISANLWPNDSAFSFFASLY